MSPKQNKPASAPLPFIYQNELSIMLGENYRITRNRINILLAIDETGSISQAARKLKMSYKGVWDAIYQIQNLSGIELVESHTGGRGGGGACLTEEARKMVGAFLKSEKRVNWFLTNLDPGIEDAGDFFGFLHRISVKTSARNQFNGVIERVKKGKISSLVFVKISERHKLAASVTNDSIQELDLKKKKSVIVLIKAPHVRLYPNATKPERGINQNSFTGKVTRVLAGDGQSEVNVSVDGGFKGGFNYTASLPEEEKEKLNIRENQNIRCMIRPTDIILGTV